MPHVKSPVATGTTPSAATTSWDAQPIVAIRVGFDSMVVVPKACVSVTGKAAALATGDALGADEALGAVDAPGIVAAGEGDAPPEPDVEQAARVATIVTTIASRAAREMTDTGRSDQVMGEATGRCYHDSKASCHSICKGTCHDNASGPHQRSSTHLPYASDQVRSGRGLESAHAAD